MSHREEPVVITHEEIALTHVMDVRVSKLATVIADSFTSTVVLVLDEVPGDETTGTVNFVKDCFSSKHVN